LTKGEIRAAADRAEARGIQTQLTDDPPNSIATELGWDR
jgi:hypothetical protein